MPELMEKLPMFLEIAAQYLSALTVIATIVVRFTPDTKDDEKVNKYAELIWKGVDYLPTLGVNPKTKKYREAYESLKKS